MHCRYLTRLIFINITVGSLHIYFTNFQIENRDISKSLMYYVCWPPHKLKHSGLFDRMLNICQATVRGDVCKWDLGENEGNPGFLAVSEERGAS